MADPLRSDGDDARPEVSVVIPTYNAAAVIGDQLEALCRQTFTGRFEVIVADNRSVDDLADAVRPFDDRLDLQVIPATERQGVSHARNVGCRAARADLLTICDADDIVSPGWLDAMVRSLRTHDLVGGYRQIKEINSPTVQRWRAPPLLAPVPPLSFLPYPNGANVGMRRAVFDAVGGWDESFVAGGDDVDFGWRAQLAGFTLGFSEDAWLHYRLRADLRTTVRQITAYNEALAALLVKYRAEGARPRGGAAVARELVWLATRSPYLLSRRSWRRGRWLVRASALYGRARGSARHRVWAL